MDLRPASKYLPARWPLRLLTLAFFALTSAWGAEYVPSGVTPPALAREFRGAWVATVKNIDWPSKPGLSTAQQKAELVAIMDRAVQLRLNALVLQIRPG